MQKSELRIGMKAPFRAAVVVEYDEPETHEESLKQADGLKALVQDWTNRGARIFFQERSGARDHFKLLVQRKRLTSGQFDEDGIAVDPQIRAELAAEMSEYLANVDVRNLPDGRAAAMKEVSVPANILASGDIEALKAHLLAQGVVLSNS